MRKKSFQVPLPSKTADCFQIVVLVVKVQFDDALLGITG
jgi:hypothetical protein